MCWRQMFGVARPCKEGEQLFLCTSLLPVIVFSFCQLCSQGVFLSHPELKSMFSPFLGCGFVGLVVLDNLI